MSVLQVVAGVLAEPAGRVLIAQRPAGRHLAGGWEFPGGKLHAGEARAAGLARELREELGIEVRYARPLIRLRHRYPDREVLLDTWLVQSFTGEPRSLDGQALRWCWRRDLPAARLLPADRPVITALRLPSVIGACGRDYRCVEIDALRQMGERGFEEAREQGEARGRGEVEGSGEAGATPGSLRGVVCADRAVAQAAVAAGADFIAFDGVLSLPQAREVCAELNVPVLLNGLDLVTAWSVGAVGLYRQGG